MPGVEFTLEYSTDDGATWAPVEARAEDSKPSIGAAQVQSLTALWRPMKTASLPLMGFRSIIRL